MSRFACGLLAGLLLAAGGVLRAQEPVRLYAAGSLRVALTEVAAVFEKQQAIPSEPAQKIPVYAVVEASDAMIARP